MFYLTAKSITRSVAEDAFRVMRELQQLYFTTVTITAKEKLCVLEKPDCNPETCPVAKGHYDRVNDAVYDILHEEMGIDHLRNGGGGPAFADSARRGPVLHRGPGLGRRGRTHGVRPGDGAAGAGAVFQFHELGISQGRR